MKIQTEKNNFIFDISTMNETNNLALDIKDNMDMSSWNLKLNQQDVFDMRIIQIIRMTV